MLLKVMQYHVFKLQNNSENMITIICYLEND